MKKITLFLLLLSPLIKGQNQFYSVKTVSGLDSIVLIPKQYKQPIFDSKSLFVISGAITGMSGLGYYLTGDPMYLNIGKVAVFTSGFGIIRLIEERDTFSANRIIRFDKPTKNDYIRFASLFIAGAGDGLRERAKFYPESLPSYMNPENTWTEKYKDGDPNKGEAYPMSTNLLVCGTDAYHRIGTIKTIGAGTYLACLTFRLTDRKYNKRELAFKLASELLLSFVSYNLGKTISMKLGR